MKEITDEQLSILREKLPCCNPLVQSLVARLDRVEGEKEDMRQHCIHCIDDPEGALCKAVAMLEAAETENSALRERVKRMEAALERVAKWHGEFPATGRTWDDGEPMSYAACYGSNGERDFMRQIAQAALKEGE